MLKYDPLATGMPFFFPLHYHCHPSFRDSVMDAVSLNARYIQVWQSETNSARSEYWAPGQSLQNVSWVGPGHNQPAFYRWSLNQHISIKSLLSDFSSYDIYKTHLCIRIMGLIPSPLFWALVFISSTLPSLTLSSHWHRLLRHCRVQAPMSPKLSSWPWPGRAASC